MTPAAEILLVDDDAAARTLLRTVLVQAGHRVSECEDGAQALERVQNVPPSLILLDVDMPRLNGWRTLAELRRRGFTHPILMLTHVNDADARVHGLDSGADDYVGKPFDLPELLARVRVLLKRAAPPRKIVSVLQFGDIVVDLERKSAMRGTQQVRLTRTEYALLGLLRETMGVPVSREKIFERVWGGKAGNTHTLDTHLWRLRHKLDDTGEEPRWIINHPGIGFALAADVVKEE